MKKLALVLGSLLVVGTAASAKEVVPAPVVVPEKVVEIVEKPVIVYRDREVAPAWRPNGSVDVQYRYYGNTENKENGNDGKEGKKASWGRKENDYGRLQTEANVNFTENQTLNIRTRNYSTLKSEKRAGLDELENEIRLRHFYNFGTLGDSKVTAKSRLEYSQKANDGKKHLEASVAFDFANYFFSNDYFKVDKFAVRPLYRHAWSRHGDDNSMNRYGLGLETTYELPFGFGLDFNIHGRYDKKLKDNRYKDGTKNGRKSKTWAEIELILSNSVNLYKNGVFAVNFDFEGGYDTYDVHAKKFVKNSDEKYERRSYSLYALPTIGVSYKPTDFVTLYANAGAEYRNWTKSAESEAKDWRWQPTAWAGAKVSF